MKANGDNIKKALEIAQDQVTQHMIESVDHIEVPEREEDDLKWHDLYQKGHGTGGKAHRYGSHLSKVAIIILAIIGAGLIGVFSVEASRKAILEWFIDQGEKEDQYHFMPYDITEEQTEEASAQPTQTPPMQMETEYVPTYIPEGMEVVWEDRDSLGYDIEYEVGEKYLYVSQSILTAGISVDSENMTREIVYIHGRKGYLNYKKGKNSLVWRTDEYVFSVAGNLEKDEVIRVAESFEKVDKK